MGLETIPQSNQPEKEILAAPVEEMFGENVFEVDPETGELKLASPDIKVEKSEKKEIPPNIIEDAEKYAETMAVIARDPKEADRIKKESYEKFLKEKGY